MSAFDYTTHDGAEPFLNVPGAITPTDTYYRVTSDGHMVRHMSEHGRMTASQFGTYALLDFKFTRGNRSDDNTLSYMDSRDLAQETGRFLLNSLRALQTVAPWGRIRCESSGGLKARLEELVDVLGDSAWNQGPAAELLKTIKLMTDEVARLEGGTVTWALHVPFNVQAAQMLPRS